MRLTIGRKLGISFGIIIFLVAANSLIAYVQLSGIISSRNRAHLRTQKLNLTYSVLANTNRLNSELRSWFLGREQKDPREAARVMNRIVADWQEVDSSVGELQQISSTFSEKDKILLEKNIPF